MLVVQIERSLEVNGYLFDALASAAQQPTVDKAEEHLDRALGRSKIYRVERETPETVAVHLIYRDGAVARVGAE